MIKHRWKDKDPETVSEIKKRLYVDDLIEGGITTAKAKERKMATQRLNCTSGIPIYLSWSLMKQSTEDQTYAKQQLGIPEGGGGAILGLQWDKQRDASSVAIPVEKADNTKRGVLAKIAKIYDWSVGTNSYPLILLRSG